MTKNETIDWEDAMTEAQHNSRLTAKLTERLLVKMSDVIDTQQRQSKTLVSLETSLSEIKAEQGSRRSSTKNQSRPKVVRVAKNPPFLPFWLGAAFVTGVAFGGFIVSL